MGDKARRRDSAMRLAVLMCVLAAAVAVTSATEHETTDMLGRILAIKHLADDSVEPSALVDGPMLGEHQADKAGAKTEKLMFRVSKLLRRAERIKRSRRAESTLLGEGLSSTGKGSEDYSQSKSPFAASTGGGFFAAAQKMEQKNEYARWKADHADAIARMNADLKANKIKIAARKIKEKAMRAKMPPKPKVHYPPPPPGFMLGMPLQQYKDQVDPKKADSKADAKADNDADSKADTTDADTTKQDSDQAAENTKNDPASLLHSPTPTEVKEGVQKLNQKGEAKKKAKKNKRRLGEAARKALKAKNKEILQKRTAKLKKLHKRIAKRAHFLHVVVGMKMAPALRQAAFDLEAAKGWHTLRILRLMAG